MLPKEAHGSALGLSFTSQQSKWLILRPFPELYFLSGQSQEVFSNLYWESLFGFLSFAGTKDKGLDNLMCCDLFCKCFFFYLHLIGDPKT